jgi:hypothetical protein
MPRLPGESSEERSGRNLRDATASIPATPLCPAEVFDSLSIACQELTRALQQLNATLWKMTLDEQFGDTNHQMR